MSKSTRPDHPILGTWRLTSFIEEDTQGGAATYPLGRHPNAMVIYADDGYCATIFTSADRKPPVAAQASDQEAVRLYRSMVAFAGRYEVEREKLIFRPKASWNEA